MTEIEEVRETATAEEANELLGKGWVLLETSPSAGPGCFAYCVGRKTLKVSKEARHDPRASPANT